MPGVAVEAVGRGRSKPDGRPSHDIKASNLVNDLLLVVVCIWPICFRLFRAVSRARESSVGSAAMTSERGLSPLVRQTPSPAEESLSISIDYAV